jgi:hypothetical protein
MSKSLKHYNYRSSWVILLLLGGGMTDLEEAQSFNRVPTCYRHYYKNDLW